MLTEIVGESDIIVLAFCFVLSYLAVKGKTWPLALISAIGLSVEAMRLYSASSDLLILGLLFLVAWAQLIIIQRRV